MTNIILISYANHSKKLGLMIIYTVLGLPANCTLVFRVNKVPENEKNRHGN
jgi:hypothetical protein